MIKVIIGYKVKNGAGIEPVLLRLNASAMTFLGFIAAENLQNQKDSSIIAMVQTWDRMENWTAWELSKIRQSILAQAKPILQEVPRVTVYRIVDARGWDSVRRES